MSSCLEAGGSHVSAIFLSSLLRSVLTTCGSYICEWKTNVPTDKAKEYPWDFRMRKNLLNSTQNYTNLAEAEKQLINGWEQKSEFCSLKCIFKNRMRMRVCVASCLCVCGVGGVQMHVGGQNTISGVSSYLSPCLFFCLPLFSLDLLILLSLRPPFFYRSVLLTDVCLWTLHPVLSGSWGLLFSCLCQSFIGMFYRKVILW